MSAELKTCPWCGVLPEVDEDGDTGCTIECTNRSCPISPSVFRDHEEWASGDDLAMGAWNTRANPAISAEVGALNPGDHPDEAKPRGDGTWLGERRCWLAEVERLRAHITAVETERDQPTEADRLLREVVEAGEHLPAFLRSEKYAIPLSKAIDRARAYLESKP